jgi:two-component sensor histidine kinase
LQSEQVRRDRPTDASGADFLRLAGAITALSAARGAEEIIEIVRRSARGLSGAQGIAVIFNDDGYCSYLVEDSESPLWAGQKFPIAGCISGWAMIHNQTVVIADIFQDERIPHDAYRPTFVKSLVMAPVGEDRPFAAIGAYWDHVRQPDPDEVAAMEALARSAATAFKNVQLYDSLKREAARAEALYRQAEAQLVQQKKSDEHLRLMVNELNHRVKNSLATVQAMAAQTFRTAGSVDEAREAFCARLHALALIHEMLTDANWDSADLRQIVQRTMDAHLGLERERVGVAGPSVRLSPKAASSLAIALNEMATNAVKHGALSGPHGRVDIDWTVTDGAKGAELALIWRESGGPTVGEPVRRGFGDRLLRRGLAGDLEGEVNLDYAASGVTCAIRAPLAALQPRPGDPALAYAGPSA